MPEELSVTSEKGQIDSTEDTSIVTPGEPLEVNTKESEELEEHQDWTDVEVKGLKEIIENLAVAIAKKEDEIASAVFDFF